MQDDSFILNDAPVPPQKTDNEEVLPFYAIGMDYMTKLGFIDLNMVSRAVSV